jgi:enolase
MAKISSIKAREILDSRAVPTIETTVQLDNGATGTSAVPSGASVGQYEAIELRDLDKNRFAGKGVLKATEYVNKVIGPGLTGVDSSRQIDIDNWLVKVDGTEQKSKFGANSLLSISQAIAKAESVSLSTPLYAYINSLYASVGGKETIVKIPTPIFNVINGGKHGTGNLDFQEFHYIPSTAKLFPDALRIGAELYRQVKKVLKDKNAITSVGDEGGYAPDLYTNLDAFEILMQTVRESSYQFGEDIFLGLDVAASVFYNKERYKIKDKQQPLSSDAFIEYYKDLNDQYHLLLLEDALSDDDWEGWKKLNSLLKDSVVLIGDDLLVTNSNRLQKAIAEQACGGILVKPNQIGTVTETLRVIKRAKDANFKVVVSHRSGETTDDFIADFSVGVQSDYAKFGAPARGERVVKYNRLLQISTEITAS